ncbi:MAG: hypothetical protein B0D92_04630 [Spirochaeta sp. LUC14_002_19_P3]|nr:MAG: hypothetical protein B0D92_04630 [Spirochaeta sp. LUC14_002_19_P3]
MTNFFIIGKVYFITMLYRYYRDSNGQPDTKATLYEKQDHGIARDRIDSDAERICARLKSHGHEAYIVGGAVRDLLLGNEPKDFDIATDAAPNRVKKIFYNARIIGRRFRLVHIYFKDGKIHEVATFRALESTGENHIFGTLDEDVMRRDFTMNALYYDPAAEIIVDFVGGMKDIRRRVVNSVLPLDTSFREDPVRMLRAVKYAAMANFKISAPVKKRIRKESALLADASTSRLSEELNKILCCGKMYPVFRGLDRYKLLPIFLPNLDSAFCRQSGGQALKEAFFANLAELDNKMTHNEISRGAILRGITENMLESCGAFQGEEGRPPHAFDVVRELKSLLRPLIQPNVWVDEAVRLMFTDRGWKFPRRRRK